MQGLTFLIPVAFTAYFFGAALAIVASVLSLLVAHGILWTENPGVLFTRPYFLGIANYVLFSSLIVTYSYRHERLLRKFQNSLRRERAARAQAERAVHLKDEFLATLSHELRTPINVILGHLQILLGERSSDPRRALEIVNRNAEQQARLIEDMLDVSRLASGNLRLDPRAVVVTPLLEEAIESLRPAYAAKTITVTGDVDAAASSSIILADPHRLRQVLWNLLSNAVKFTPPGGHITTRLTTAAGEVVITIEDDGEGITPAFLPHVFEMFRQADATPTRAATGMGLGLHLVKRLVELQGGRVDIESAGAGLGTTATCRFPLYVTAAAPATSPSEHRRKSLLVNP
jgi:signal transduction histidine kinase